MEYSYATLPLARFVRINSPSLVNYRYPYRVVKTHFCVVHQHTLGSPESVSVGLHVKLLGQHYVVVLTTLRSLLPPLNLYFFSFHYRHDHPASQETVQ